MVTEAREQGNLIGSDKVEGTAVYGADRTKIGSIERVMIDKQSGRVSYAVPPTSQLPSKPVAIKSKANRHISTRHH